MKVPSQTNRVGVGSTIHYGRVKSISKEGLISVCTDNDTQNIVVCNVLSTINMNSCSISPETPVIFVLPSNQSIYGCILGVITGYEQPCDTSNDNREVENNHYKETFKSIEIKAESGLTLKCGKGSLSIHPNGTIQIRGTRILSRSTGVNKVKGATVQIN